MKSLHRFPAKLFIIFILLAGMISYAHARRIFDPVVVEAWFVYDVSDPVPIENTVAYKYNAASNTWTCMPFQIDQRDPSSGKFLMKENASGDFFDRYDEIVFFLQDCGDQAPQQAWIDDPSSRNYRRCDIDVTDPLNQSHRYAYIFRTDTPQLHPVAGTTDYVHHVPFYPDSDCVYSDYYRLSHNNAGLISGLKVPASANGGGFDFLERLKIRAKCESVKWAGQDIPYSKMLDERDIQINGNPTVIDGKIRVLRRWNVKIAVDLGLTVEFKRSFMVIYYPNWADFGIEPLDLSEATISFARYSFDLEPNSLGMKMFSSISYRWEDKFPDGVPIDHQEDSGILPRNFVVPGWNWWMQTGTPGTLLTESYISVVGHYQELYYKDSSNNGTNDGVSGSYDTGSNYSWGDTGAKFTGSGISGNLPFAARLYFLGNGVTPDSAWAIRDMIANPLVATPSLEYVPVELAGFDISVQKNNVTLKWITAAESNNLGFAVERRSEKGDWRQIAFLKGAGTSQKAQNYYYHDEPDVSGNVSYRLKQVDLDGTATYYPEKTVSIAVPLRFALAQNFPNPFNPSTLIDYEIPRGTAGDISLEIYDLLGRHIRTLVDGSATAGYFHVLWDGRDEYGSMTGSGIYFYTLQCNDFRMTKRMVKIQ